MPNVRSGHHRELIGNTWYYRRVVPPDVRDVFGVTKVKKSLGTSSETEAKRLEKIHDVEFEEKLRQAREAGSDGYARDPSVRTEELVAEVYISNLLRVHAKHTQTGHTLQWAYMQ